MKSHRSALLGLALGVAVLGMTACESKDEIVIPTPENPIAVSLVPDALTLEVGETGQLVAVVSGGPAGTDRTVTFTSSNDNVATVDGSGVVTAVGAGVTTITARSTADTNAADASAVTVTPEGTDAPPPTISIQSITTGSLNTPVNINNVFGQIDVTLNLDAAPGSSISSIETLIDGDVVCSQDFTSAEAALAIAASNELGAEAQPVEIVCSINTAAFDATTGEVTFDNGPRTLQARVVGPDGTITASTSTDLVFNNINFISAAVSSTNGPANGGNAPGSLDPAGSAWHGGDVTFTMLAVNFRGDDHDIAEATVSITTEGFGVHGMAGCQTTGVLGSDPTIATNHGGAGPTVDPDAGGPLTPNPAFPGCGPATSSRTVEGATGETFEVTFPADARMGGTTNGVMQVEDVLESVLIQSVTTGGQAGPICINPDPANNPMNLCGTGAGGTAANEAFFENPLRVDNLAPRVTQLNILRPNQYYNEEFVPAHASGSANCPADVPCARTVDYGVDQQTSAGNTTFHAGPATDELVDVTENFGALEESVVATTNLFAISTSDALENERTVYATPTNTTVASPDANGNVPGALLFGIDNTDPTLDVDGPPDNSTNCPIAPSDPTTCAGDTGWTVAFSDAGVGPSGFNANPVSTKLERILSTGAICLHPDSGATISCAANNNDGFVADDGNSTIPAVNAYYRLTVFVTDAAGNVSEEEVILTLRDYTAPTAGGIASPAVITGGAATAFTSALADDVEIGDVLPATTFGGTGVVLAENRQAVGTYGVDVFHPTDVGAVNIAQFIRSVEATTGAGLPTNTVNPATLFELNTRDVAGGQLNNQVADGCPVAGAADGSTTQNCVLRRVDISAAVVAGVGTGGFTDYSALNTLNGTNALHGLFVHQAPTNTTVCTLVTTNCAGSPVPPKSTVLSVTLTGPAATFNTPFNRVVFYMLDAGARWVPIGTGASQVTDDTVLDTRTFTYSFTWTPAGLPAFGAQIIAIGINSSGAALLSQPQAVTLIDA